MTTERRPNVLARVFVTLGVLPFLLVAAVVIFSLMSDNFLTVRNLTNVVRQSVYLTIVSLAAVTLVASVLLASWLPALRATRVAPTASIDWAMNSVGL